MSFFFFSFFLSSTGALSPLSTRQRSLSQLRVSIFFCLSFLSPSQKKNQHTFECAKPESAAASTGAATVTKRPARSAANPC